MTTNFVQTCKTSANRINLNRTAMRVVLIGLFISLDISNAWGDSSPTYKLQLKTVTQNNTGYGKVYATEANVAPEYSSYYTSKDPAYDAVETGSKEYYLWAVPTRRGVVFDKWTTSSTSSGSCTAGSSTLTDANKMQGAKVTVKAPTNASGTDTYTTTATVTANWKDPYSKAVVTYATPTDGKYRVTYEYSYLNTSTNALETGFTFDMDGSSAARSENSYNNDVITLQSLDGVFEGWYNGSTLLSTNNPYTYVAPASGGSITISAHYTHVDKYYGKLTASIAEVPYSMPGGGTIFIANDPDVSGTYSADAQSVSNETYGESQNYYLHAQPNDKRYVFRGWYSDAACTSLISTNADYAYTFISSSTNSASPTLGNVYAAFDFNLYYMQVEVEPAVPGLGMVFVKDDNSTTPVYTEYTTHSEQFLYAYRLAPTANAYLYAKPKYGYKFSGWYDNPDCTGTAKSTANPYTYAATGTSTDPMNPTIIKLYAKFVEDATTVNITYNLPDQTKGEYTASVLDIAEVDDDFIWTFTQVFTSEGKTGNTTQAQHKTDVLRLEAQPKTGYGVTSWTIAGAAKTTPSQLYETTGTAAATYGVTFGDAKPFLVSTNSTQYATLREALTAVGNSGQITVVQNAYVEAGNYTIPSGVTLLVPYESTGKSYTSPSKTYEKAQNFASATQYVLLTIGSGANIYLAGSIIVMADLCAPNGGGFGSGAPLSAYGRIAMSENSTITVNSGANLYCWGYITGIEGLVTAKSGATIHEIFQHQNNPGGSAATGWNEDAFFLNQYYVQNIESPLKIEYGASETVYAQMSVPSGSINNLSATLIDKDNTGMFALTSSGSYLIRTYSPSTDRITYDIYGNAKLNYISMSVYGMDLNTSKYVLPITSNMSVKCHPINGASSTFIVQYAVSFIPGAELIVDEGVTLNAQNKLIIYDREEWIDKGFAQFNLHSGGSNWSRSSFTPTRTYTRVKADLVDAKVDLNGTMNVSGSLYTTNSGADIISSNGTGVVKLLAAAPNNSNDIQYSSNKLGTSIKVPMTPAQLRNGDDSYTLTAGAVANDQFIYSKSQEKWLKNPKVVSWNANGGTTEASTLAYSQGSFVGELPAAYKDGYTLEGWYTAADGGTKIAPSTKVTANVTYYAHWTPKSYSITYRDQGGAAFSGTHVDSPNAHPTTHTFGTATTLNGVNNKTGYTFGGWYRTPSCSGTVVTSIAASECKNIALYAKWIPNTHKLTWDWNGGATSSTTYTAAGDAVAYNTTIVYPADNTLTKTNFVFNGWDKSITTMPDEDLTITAQWTPAVASVAASGTPTTYHATVADAIYAANGKSNAVVTILQNASVASEVTITAAMTIDLNGKTVSSNQAAATGVFNINASSKTVTIKDSGTGGKIDHTANYSGGYMYGINLTAGTLNITSGTIYAKNTANNRAYGIYANGSTAIITMSKGTVEAESSNAPFGLYANAINSFTMTGGTFSANGPTARGVYTKGTTTLTDATITASGTDSYAIFAKAGTMIINSGTYTATGTSSYVVYYEAGTVTVNGGEFSGAAGELKPKSSYGTNVKLQGGYYVHDTDLEANCATNYHVLPLTGEDPYKYEVAEAYTITFNNYDGTQLQSTAVKKDVMPSYSGEEPSKAADAQYTYAFTGWSPALATVTAAATYTATFTQTVNKYTITWVDGNGVTLKTEDLEYGAIPSYTGTTPTKTEDENYTYTFNDTWTPEIASVTGDATYTAQFAATSKETGFWADIVDVDNSANTLTLNVTGWASSGWPYTINDVEYKKTARETDRTLIIPYTGEAGGNFTITVVNNSSTTVSKHNYIIPTAITSNTILGNQQVIFVKPDIKLTVDADKIIKNIYVAPGAKLVVNSGKTLTADTVFLRTTPWASAELELNGTITGQVCYTRIISKKDGYYQFGLPMPCNIADVRLSDGTKPVYGNGWLLRSYSESNRAQNGTGTDIDNWVTLTSTGADDAEIQGRTGYEMFSNSGYYREYYFPVAHTGMATSVAVTRTTENTKGAAHEGWNIVCSPLMNVYKNESNPVDGLKVSWLRTDGYYDQEWPETIWPAMPFSYQASANGNLDFSSDEFNQTVSAPRRAAYKEDIQTEWIHLDVKDGNGAGDHTSIFAHPDRFEDTYETGIDVAKQSLTASRAILYSTHAYGDMAFAGVSDSKLTNGIPLVVYSPKAQELTISMRENAWLNRLTAVWLIDHETGIRTDLLWSTYTFDAAEGTAKGRFTLMGEFKAPQVTTGLENGQSDQEPSTKARKVIIEDKIYIQLNGHMYDSTGKKVN